MTVKAFKPPKHNNRGPCRLGDITCIYKMKQHQELNPTREKSDSSLLYIYLREYICKIHMKHSDWFFPAEFHSFRYAWDWGPEQALKSTLDPRNPPGWRITALLWPPHTHLTAFCGAEIQTSHHHHSQFTLTLTSLGWGRVLTETESFSLPSQTPLPSAQESGCLWTHRKYYVFALLLLFPSP